MRAVSGHHKTPGAPPPLNRGAAIAVLLAIQLAVGLLLAEGILRAMYQHPAA